MPSEKTKDINLEKGEISTEKNKLIFSYLIVGGFPSF